MGQDQFARRAGRDAAGQLAAGATGVGSPSVLANRNRQLRFDGVGFLAGGTAGFRGGHAGGGAEGMGTIARGAFTRDSRSFHRTPAPPAAVSLLPPPYSPPSPGPRRNSAAD